MLAVLLLISELPSAFAVPADDVPLAPAVIVWAEAALPPPEVQTKAARLTAGGTHFAWGDIAYVPSDRTQDDRMRIDAVQTAADAARKRWDEFDVELGIAQALRATLENVTLVKDESDRNALVQGLVLESTAVMRAFPDSKFATIEAAAPFRVVVGDMVVSRPLADLVALDPDRAWTREELGDGQILVRIQQYREALKNLTTGTVHFGAAPTGATLVLDGRPLAPGVSDAPAFAGHHYAHVQVGTRIAGRVEFDVAAGQVVEVPAIVDQADLAAAKALLLEGRTEGLPTDFGLALAAIPPVSGKTPRIYVAVLDENGKGHVLPWSAGTVLIRPKPVTFILTGDVGGGFYNSKAFAQREGEVRTAAQFGPQLGAQLGIYNLMINMGGTMALVPTERFAYGGEPFSPTLTPAGVRVWAGLGAYLPRPTKRVPLLSVGVNYGMFFPGSHGVGGSLTFGVPVTDGRTWLRLSLDGFNTVQSPGWPQAGESAYAGAFRLGFGRLL